MYVTHTDRFMYKHIYVYIYIFIYIHIYTLKFECGPRDAQSALSGDTYFHVRFLYAYTCIFYICIYIDVFYICDTCR